MEQTVRIENNLAFSAKEIMLLQNKLGIPTCKATLTRLCKFCKEPFQPVHDFGFFCTQECGSKFAALKQRIVSVFTSDEEIRREWKKLTKQGIYYRFPKAHEDLNIFYGLKKK